MPDIATPHLDYNSLLAAWDINDALMGGTLYLRQQGERYLPRWPHEDKHRYQQRLAVATLLPGYPAGHVVQQTDGIYVRRAAATQSGVTQYQTLAKSE